MVVATTGASCASRVISRMRSGDDRAPDPAVKRGGYQGQAFQAGVRRVCRCFRIEIVKRSDQPKGFTVLPKRWIVERTIAWLNRCR